MENNGKREFHCICYIDSATRHYLKHLRGDTDERHDRAYIWNLICAMWTLSHKPELDDVEIDIHDKVKPEIILRGPNGQTL